MGAGSSATPAVPPAAASGAPAATEAVMPLSQKQVGFVRQHGAAARAAEAQSGIPAAFMIGQAAHESGWGRQEIRNADGSSAKNLFGIKAGAGWNGPVAEITTTEYVDGVAQKVTAKFRAYASYDESFRDYARMLKESPRYAAVAAQAAQAPQRRLGRRLRPGPAARRLRHRPAYADKLARVINTTMRVQRATA
jgi:flagellar protein FlgJ